MFAAVQQSHRFALESMEKEEIEGNLAAQADELEALKHIYGEDCIVYATDHFVEIHVYPADGERHEKLGLNMSVYFPDTYPSKSEPVYKVEAAWINQELRENLVLGFHQIYSDGCGDVVIFRWVEWLKEQYWLWEEAKLWIASHVQPKLDKSLQDRGATSASHHEILHDRSSDKDGMKERELTSIENLSDNTSELDKMLGIFHGSPFTEKRSTFQAHLSSVRSFDEVVTVMEALKQNRKIAGATHNIMAYRISAQNGTVLQDYDDDGETAAGSRLLHLLRVVDANDVVVVVSRWFGGILLGSDRFKHINNAARALLQSCGYIKVPSSGPASSKQKLETKKFTKGKGK